MPNALIFDVDGVLADSEPISISTLNQAFRESHGIELTDEDSLDFMGATARRHVGGIVEKYGLDADIEAIVERHESLFISTIQSAESVPIRDSVDLFKKMVDREDWLVGIATSSSRQRSTATLTACGIQEEEIDAWLTGDDITSPKPNPEIYIACALAIGVPPADCVVIEDSVAGVASAKAAGMTCIALTGTFPGEQLNAADRIVDTLASIDITMLYDLLHEANEGLQ
jgi:HAD superfamily hydrolase (TIGR01509 family)